MHTSVELSTRLNAFVAGAEGLRCVLVVDLRMAETASKNALLGTSAAERGSIDYSPGGTCIRSPAIREPRKSQTASKHRWFLIAWLSDLVTSLPEISAEIRTCTHLASALVSVALSSHALVGFNVRGDRCFSVLNVPGARVGVSSTGVSITRGFDRPGGGR